MSFYWSSALGLPIRSKNTKGRRKEKAVMAVLQWRWSQYSDLVKLQSNQSNKRWVCEYVVTQTRFPDNGLVLLDLRLCAP